MDLDHCSRRKNAAENVQPPVVARQEILLAGKGNDEDHVQDREDVHYRLAFHYAHSAEGTDARYDVLPVGEFAADPVLRKYESFDGHFHNPGVFVVIVVGLCIVYLIWEYQMNRQSVSIRARNKNTGTNVQWQMIAQKQQLRLLDYHQLEFSCI